jgi:hypothetical protein
LYVYRKTEEEKRWKYNFGSKKKRWEFLSSFWLPLSLFFSFSFYSIGNPNPRHNVFLGYSPNSSSFILKKKKIIIIARRLAVLQKQLGRISNIEKKRSCNFRWNTLWNQEESWASSIQVDFVLPIGQDSWCVLIQWQP